MPGVKKAKAADKSLDTVTFVEGDGEKKRKKRVKYPLWKRFLIFMLGVLIGALSCIGSIIGGGIWIYNNFSSAETFTGRSQERRWD